MKTANFRPIEMLVILCMFLILFFVSACSPAWNINNRIIQCGIVSEDDARDSEYQSAPWTLFRLSPWQWWSNDVYVFSLVPFMNMCDTQTGVAVAGGVNYARKSAGLQLSLLGSFAETLNGVQISCLNVRESGSGLSVGIINDLPLLRHCGEMCGVQIGVVNVIDHTPGLLQIGVYNDADNPYNNSNFLQIGVWNYNGSFGLPLINLNFKRGLQCP